MARLAADDERAQEPPVGWPRRRVGDGDRAATPSIFDETLAGHLRPPVAAIDDAGTVLGLASLVATLGILRTAGTRSSSASTTRRPRRSLAGR